jgi:hypothetical protein
MKFIIDWVRKILNKEVKVYSVPVFTEETEEQEPEKKGAPKSPGEASPKLTKAALNKLTKAGIAKEGEKLGITISSKLKKEEMVKQLIKHK